MSIKCPTCGKVLKLEERPNIANASFTCPVCKVKHKVGECQRLVKKTTIASEETQYGSNPSTSCAADETQYNAPGMNRGGEETQLYGSGVSSSMGSLVDTTTGRTYKLAAGINIVGRNSATSPATVKIDDPSGYMSRNHAVIETRNVGGQIVYLFKNGKNQNPTYINGQLVKPGDQLILNNGDKLKLAYTELTFKK